MYMYMHEQYALQFTISVYTCTCILFTCTLQDTRVELMENILPDGKIKVSSNEAMSNSLNDGSTETFWESRDEGRGKPRYILVTFDKPTRVFAACIHIDNQKDSGVSL